MTNPVVHIDIPLNDLGSGTEFYRAVFGWDLNASMPGYPMFSAEGGPGGGFIQKDEQNGYPVIYLMSHDIDASLREIEANGGKTVMPRTEIEGGHGAFAIFTDPNGTKLALYSPPAQNA